MRCFKCQLILNSYVDHFLIFQKSVINSRQLPTQFFSAYSVLENMEKDLEGKQILKKKKDDQFLFVTEMFAISVAMSPGAIQMMTFSVSWIMSCSLWSTYGGMH